MNDLMQEYLTQKQTLKYWILTDLISIALPVVGIFTAGSGNEVAAIVLFIAGFAAIIVAIIGMNGAQKRMNQAGLAITKQVLAEQQNDAERVTQKLKAMGLPTTYLRICLRNTADRPQKEPVAQQEDTTLKASNPCCPSCQSERVHWIPFEKAKFGIWFWFYLVGSALGMVFSPFATACVFICWILVMISRIATSRRAQEYNRMQCELCGTVFEVPKTVVGKGDVR